MQITNKHKYFVGKVNDYTKRKGWFFGNFADNQLLQSDLVEVAWQNLSNNTPSPTDKHYHTSSVEINIVINGAVRLTINGEKVYVKKGEFYVVWPETTVENFESEDNAELIVVRAPSINDKTSL